MRIKSLHPFKNSLFGTNITSFNFIRWEKTTYRIFFTVFISTHSKYSWTCLVSFYFRLCFFFFLFLSDISCLCESSLSPSSLLFGYRFSLLFFSLRVFVLSLRSVELSCFLVSLFVLISEFSPFAVDFLFVLRPICCISVTLRSLLLLLSILFRFLLRS